MARIGPLYWLVGFFSLSHSPILNQYCILVWFYLRLWTVGRVQNRDLTKMIISTEDTVSIIGQMTNITLKYIISDIGTEHPIVSISTVEL